MTFGITEGDSWYPNYKIRRIYEFRGKLTSISHRVQNSLIFLVLSLLIVAVRFRPWKEGKTFILTMRINLGKLRESSGIGN